MTTLRDILAVKGNGEELELSLFSHSVIVEDEKVLLVRGYRNHNFWTFPGEECRDDAHITASATTLGLKGQLGLDSRSFQDIDEPFIYLYEIIPSWIDIFFHYKIKRYEGQEMKVPGTNRFGWYDVNNLPRTVAPNVIHALKYFGHKNVREI